LSVELRRPRGPATSFVDLTPLPPVDVDDALPLTLEPNAEPCVPTPDPEVSSKAAALVPTLAPAG
jgi:hypothetical protein